MCFGTAEEEDEEGVGEEWRESLPFASQIDRDVEEYAQIRSKNKLREKRINTRGDPRGKRLLREKKSRREAREKSKKS